MTVKQLKEKLNELPEDAQVFVGQRVTEFGYGLVNSIYTKEIPLLEDEDGEELATEKVVVIDEE